MKTALLTAVIVIFSLPLAHADVKVSKRAKARAKVLIKKGNTSYRLAKFNEGLAQYQAAYKLYGHPAILFNIAQCYRQLKNYERALFFYKLSHSDWRKRKHTPRVVQEVQSKIDQVQALIKQEQQKAEKKKQEQRRLAEQRRAEQQRLAREKRAEQRRLAEEQRKDRQRKLALVPTRPPPPRAKPSPFYKKWWFWTAVGVAVAGATVGTVVALQPEDGKPVGGTMGSFPIQ